jgi:hypothetical protein
MTPTSRPGRHGCRPALRLRRHRGPGTGRCLPPFRATTVTSRETFDTTIVAFEPCAGEDVAFHLLEQRVRHTTFDANGVIHDLEVVNDKGTRAVGLVTGRVWNQTGATVNHINIDLTEDDVDNQTITNTLQPHRARLDAEHQAAGSLPCHRERPGGHQVAVRQDANVLPVGISPRSADFPLDRDPVTRAPATA